MKLKLPAFALTLIILTGCGSIGLDSLGDILGSGGATQPSDVRGVVVSVDSQRQLINLDVTHINQLRETRTGSVIHYDNNTVVEYQNRTYRPEDLERGDEVAVTGRNEGGRYVASRIVVTRNIRS
jgi:hypothetical protein